MECYDANSQQWSELPEMPTARHSCCAVVLGEKLYVAGGQVVGTAVGGEDMTISLNTMECYDPKLQQWTARPAMNTERSHAAAAVVGGKMYVMGGQHSFIVNSAAGTTANMECFDPETGQWSAMPPMLTARSHLTADAIGEKIYVLSGADEHLHPRPLNFFFNR